MTNEIRNEEKLLIIDSKINFLNEAIYNYDLELEMFAAETGVDPDREPVAQMRLYKQNALAKMAILETRRQEVLSNI
jgi:hypothetical protein